MEEDTSRLRLSASNWSLAGDSQLLDILQSLHQTIIAKCKETNGQLERMMSSLDEASIHLQNVNNKFLGLSNSQFVESRVYDDHTEIAEDNNKDSPQRAPLSPVSSLKLCLHTLESLHEAVPVMDSDSDEEGSARVILRPLVRRGRDTHEVVSSDADSEDSSQQETQLEAEYSDSDTEEEQQPDAHEHTIPPQPPVLVTSHTPPDTMTSQTVISPELDESPIGRKLYTDKPVTAQIFPEEPPPLDEYDSDTDDDIFTDLHTHTHSHTPTHMGDIGDDLFGGGEGGAGRNRDDVTDLARSQKSPGTTSVAPAAPQTPVQEYITKENVKKPAGGISLFGGAGPEAIGAAVLRRTRRQSSTDSETTDTHTNKTNVIDELFTKPAKNVKKAPVDVKKEPKIDKDISESSAKDKKDKIDLFSDDIFDDIDDIFTSNVMNTTKDSKNTLFNDDLFNDSNDNDLFNDKSKSVKFDSNVNKENRVRNIFDSDSEDDLFFDAKGKDKELDATKDTAKDKDYKSNERLLVKNKEESKAEPKDQLSPNLFDDDDDFFSVAPSRNVTGEHGDKFGDDIRDDQRQGKNETEKMEGVEINDTETEDWLEEKHVGDAETTDANIRVLEKNIVYNEFNDDFEDSGPIEKDSVKSTDKENNDEKFKDDNSPPPKEKDLIEETKDNRSEEQKIEDAKDTNTNDIFVDIFSDLPPAFEKPVEPKKSKNVNALFDDDSDDEALFFKKDDVITDEKPEIDFSSDRFRIFHDEPPDIDVDFTTRFASEQQTPHLAGDLETVAHVETVTNEKSNMVSEKCKETRNDGVNMNIDNVTKNTNKINILKLLENEKNNSDGGNERKEDLFTETEKDDANLKSKTETKEIKSEEETDSTERENRVIGKLKPTKLNINVNTLLPGAVPKKPVNYEETDGQVMSRAKEDSAVVEEQKEKLVSFKEETNSGVLDNKLSKERARIQVKRRPSTRRARLEAVRKTGLDFGSDSTDNSSSFDEPIREMPKDSALKKETTMTVTKQTDNRDVISKVVYVLNDEDIFDIPKTATAAGRPEEEDLTKTMISTENRDQETRGDERQEQKTGGKKTKKSLFDDSDDETELFGKQTKKYIFDSDSDSELFGKDKGKILKDIKTEEKDKARKVDKKPMKIPLFSDDSDEDLFGGKTKKIEVKKTPQARAVPKTSQTFDDPLSVLEDEHDTH